MRILDELARREQTIDFDKSEIKEIKESIKRSEIQKAHATLLKGEGEQKWRDAFMRTSPQYYRKGCALAANYWKKGDQRPLLVIVHRDVSSDLDFMQYYGTNQEGFFKRVYHGDFLPVVGDVEAYKNNPYLMDFFESWAKNREVRDFWPVYANRLEAALAREKGYADWATFLQGVRDKYGKRFASLKGINLLPVGNLQLQGDAFEYHVERIARFKLLDLDLLVKQIEDLLDKVIKDKRGAVQPLDLEEAKTFTFSMFQLFGAHVFYSKGGIENISMDDLDRICESMKRWEGDKLPPVSDEGIRKGVSALQVPTASLSERYLKHQQVNTDLVEGENRIYYACREEGEVSHDESMLAYNELDTAPKALLAGNISEFEAERRVDILEQALQKLSEANKEKFSTKFDLANLGLSAAFGALGLGLSFVAPPLGAVALLSLASGYGSMKLKPHLVNARATEFVIPCHIWQYELTDSQFKERIIRLPIFR